MRKIAPDAVNQTAPARDKAPVNHASQRPIVLDSHMLQHPHRDESVAWPAAIPPIVLNEFDAIIEVLAAGGLAGGADLLAGDVVRTNGHAVPSRHMQCEA